MKHADEIIKEAFEKYNPAKVLLLFSGGHDSLVSTHFAASHLRLKNIPFTVYHGDTTIGIPETQQFVKDVCKMYGWDLAIRQPTKGNTYEDVIKEHGFPGATKSSHQLMYRRLKERALRAYVTHECKSSPYARENVLLISGVRKSESTIRMGYEYEIQKEDSRVWCAPIFWWSDPACKRYIKGNNLPENPVKKTLCISGECLCGCFAKPEERAEIKAAYPHVDKRLDELHRIAKENGHPWPWGQGPNEWYKKHPPGQLDIFMPMCVGCESKRS